MTKSQEQFSRMMRWYQRFEELNNGIPHSRPSDFYEDDVYAFFFNCYHLKDWLINDSTLPETVRDAVENYINESPTLGLTADICNSLKHLVLHKKKRTNQNPTFTNKAFSLEFNETINPSQPLDAKAVIRVKFNIETKDGVRDAFEIATEAMVAWKEFFTTHNLV